MTMEQTCRRWSKCAAMEPHEGKRHNDPRDDLYDGPSTLLQVLPHAIRNQVRKIVDQAPALTPELVDIAEHVQFLRDQVALVSVDRDHKVREAMARSADCQVHGEQIEDLSGQLHAMDAHQRRTEAGRLALLCFLVTVDEALTNGFRPGLTVPELAEALSKVSKKTHAAHTRAWSK